MSKIIPENTHTHRSELLIPAGNLEKLKTAILYGADAVYCGTPDLSLRTKSGFTLDELITGINYAHAHKRKVYLTLNLFTHNRDVEKLPAFIDTIKEAAPDGVIVADPGVFSFIKERAPELELHISTQANISSWLTIDYWQKQGATRAVLAREVSFTELKEIRHTCPNIKLESFIHGAMCMSHSGRCLLSNFMTERGANQGNCAQSCRWLYTVHLKLKNGKTEELSINESNRHLFDFFLEEEFRPGDLIPLVETDNGSFLMSSKDLCLMPVLNEYLEIGIDSLKVEGRHKNQFYVACITRIYRQAIDNWYADPLSWDPAPYMVELDALRNRGYTLAFHNGNLTNLSQNYDTTASTGDGQFGGFVQSWEEDALIFEVRNTLQQGDILEFLPPNNNHTGAIPITLVSLIDAKTGKEHEKVSPGQGYAIKIPCTAFKGYTKEDLISLLPERTVARVEMTRLTPEHKTQLILRRAAQQVELGKMSQEEYDILKYKDCQ